MSEVNLGTLADAIIRAEVAERTMYEMRQRLAECRRDLRRSQRENNALRLVVRGEVFDTSELENRDD